MKSGSRRALILLTFLFAACSIFVRAQTPAAPRILISNSEHYIFYRVEEENVVLTIELIDDFTDHMKGDYPNVDFVSINVDVDQNAEVSDRVDTAYGLKGKPTWSKKDWTKEPFVTGLCTQFLISDNSSTPCGKFMSKSALDFGFRATDIQSALHPVYAFTIPRGELSGDGRTAHLRIRIFSAGKGYTIYPAPARGEKYHAFSNTLKLDF